MITKLKDQQGNWTDDWELLKETAWKFYMSLYLAEPSSLLDNIKFNFSKLSNWILLNYKED